MGGIAFGQRLKWAWTLFTGKGDKIVDTFLHNGNIYTITFNTAMGQTFKLKDSSGNKKFYDFRTKTKTGGNESELRLLTNVRSDELYSTPAELSNYQRDMAKDGRSQRAQAARLRLRQQKINEEQWSNDIDFMSGEQFGGQNLMDVLNNYLGSGTRGVTLDIYGNHEVNRSILNYNIYFCGTQGFPVTNSDGTQSIDPPTIEGVGVDLQETSLQFSMDRAQTIKDNFFLNNANVTPKVNQGAAFTQNGVRINSLGNSPVGISIKFNFDNVKSEEDEQHFDHYVDPLFLNN